MTLRNVPPAILVALGLGCGPSTGSDEESSLSACLSPPYDSGDSLDSGCLSKPEEDGEVDDGEVGPCLSECLDTTGGFISASSDGTDSSGTDTGSTGTESSGTDSSGTDSSGTGSSDGGSDSGTSGGTEDASPRARAWHEALSKMEHTLPVDVVAKLRARKGPR